MNEVAYILWFRGGEWEISCDISNKKVHKEERKVP